MLYGNLPYNESTYGTGYVLLVFLESFAPLDGTESASIPQFFDRYNDFVYNENTYGAGVFQTAVFDSVTLADDRAMALQFTLGDAIVLLEGFDKRISNKGLFEKIRLNDWLEVRKNPQSDPWGG
jgi:hypothetical protein